MVLKVLYKAVSAIRCHSISNQNKRARQPHLPANQKQQLHCSSQSHWSYTSSQTLQGWNKSIIWFNKYIHCILGQSETKCIVPIHISTELVVLASGCSYLSGKGEDTGWLNIKLSWGESCRKAGKWDKNPTEQKQSLHWIILNIHPANAPHRQS